MRSVEFCCLATMIWRQYVASGNVDDMRYTRYAKLQGIYEIAPFARPREERAFLRQSPAMSSRSWPVSSRLVVCWNPTPDLARAGLPIMFRVNVEKPSDVLTVSNFILMGPASSRVPTRTLVSVGAPALRGGVTKNAQSA